MLLFQTPFWSPVKVKHVKRTSSPARNVSVDLAAGSNCLGGGCDPPRETGSLLFGAPGMDSKFHVVSDFPFTMQKGGYS